MGELRRARSTCLRSTQHRCLTETQAVTQLLAWQFLNSLLRPPLLLVLLM